MTNASIAKTQSDIITAATEAKAHGDVEPFQLYVALYLLSEIVLRMPEPK